METGFAQGKTVPPKLEEEAATERVQIVATERWTKRLDDWRRRHPDLPNRSAAIRMLVEQALDAEVGEKAKRKSPS